MRRSEAREKVFKILFQKEFHENFKDLYPLLAQQEDLKGVQGTYALTTIEGILENLEEIDHMIETHLNGWTLNRLPKTVLAILRLGVYEVQYNQDIPKISAIDEAVKLSHIYCEEKDSSFINGILNNIYQKDSIE